MASLAAKSRTEPPQPPLDRDLRLGLIKEAANVLVAHAGHLEIIEDIGGVGFHEHPKRVGISPLVDGLKPPLVHPIAPHILQDVLLALLEPLGLIKRYAVQAPAHERHALRQKMFQSAFG
jgi:hypothetical protein